MTDASAPGTIRGVRSKSIRSHCLMCATAVSISTALLLLCGCSEAERSESRAALDWGQQESDAEHASRGYAIIGRIDGFVSQEGGRLAKMHPVFHEPMRSRSLLYWVVDSSRDTACTVELLAPADWSRGFPVLDAETGERVRDLAKALQDRQPEIDRDTAHWELLMTTDPLHAQAARLCGLAGYTEADRVPVNAAARIVRSAPASPQSMNALAETLLAGGSASAKALLPPALLEPMLDTGTTSMRLNLEAAPDRAGRYEGTGLLMLDSGNAMANGVPLSYVDLQVENPDSGRTVIRRFVFLADLPTESPGARAGDGGLSWEGPLRLRVLYEAEWEGSER